MNPFKKLLEALDVAIAGFDTLSKEDPDSIFTESQLDDQLLDMQDKYFEDLNIILENASPEFRERFDADLDKMIEEADPELFTEAGNVVRFNRQTVLNQLIGLFSLVIARRRKDPVFAVYKKGSLLRRKAKKKIREKYASRAVAISRRYLKKRKFKV